MSAFKRRGQPVSQIPMSGVRPSALPPFHPLVSTGIPSFDDVLGGGIPLSTSLLLQAPDPHSAWCQLIQRYYIAQGLRSGHDLCLVGIPDEVEAVLNGCMWVAPDAANSALTADPLVDDEGEGASSESVKIAWRYSGMRRFSTTVSHEHNLPTSGDYCSNFDLTRQIAPSIVQEVKQNGRVTVIPVDVEHNPRLLSSALPAIAKTSSPFSYSASSPADKVLRICVFIPSLLDVASDQSQRILLQFLHVLRVQLRSCRGTVLISLPPNLSSRASLSHKAIHLADGAVTLLSNALLPVSTHHGILRLNKLPSVRSLLSPSDRLSTLRGLGTVSRGDAVQRGGGGENNLAFRCKRRAFVIETLNLDVEGGIGERRTGPPAAGVIPPAQSQAPIARQVPDVAPLMEVQPSTTPLHVSAGDEAKGSSDPKRRQRMRSVAFRVADGLYDF